MKDKIKSPAILQRNFALSYGEQALIAHEKPWVSVSALDTLAYKMPLQSVSSDVVRVSSPFKINVDLSVDSLTSKINKLSKLRAEAMAELRNDFYRGPAYEKYLDAVHSFSTQAGKLESKITSYGNGLASAFGGSAVATERNELRRAANAASKRISDLVQQETEFASKLSEATGTIAQNTLHTAEKGLNDAIYAFHTAIDDFSSADTKLREVGRAFKKMLKMPWQKQIKPSEFYAYAPDFSNITNRIKALAEGFGLDALETSKLTAVLENADQATMDYAERLLGTGNRAGFMNWLTSQSNKLTSVAKDLKDSGVKLAGVSAEATTSLAKNIHEKGESIAAEVSKVAADNKIVGSFVDKLKEFLSMKDFKNAFKICEKEPQAKSLLTSTCLKYAGIIGLGAAAIAGLTAYQRKKDRENQEAKYTAYGMRGI